MALVRHPRHVTIPNDGCGGCLLDDRRPAHLLPGCEVRPLPHSAIHPPGLEHDTAGTSRLGMCSDAVGVAVHPRHRSGCSHAQGRDLDLLAWGGMAVAPLMLAIEVRPQMLADPSGIRHTEPERVELT